MASLMEMRGQMLLTAGERVNIRLEYIEQTGNAKIKLEWSCASRAREVIPTERLYSARTGLSGVAVKGTLEQYRGQRDHLSSLQM